MSVKSIRFAQTINTKNFGARLSALLSEQYEDMSLNAKIDKVRGAFASGDFELSLLYLSRIRKDLEVFSMFVGDTEQNVSAFVDLDKEPPTKEEQSPQPIEKEAEVVSAPMQQATDPMQQLQQIEKLVNVVKGLKGESP